jgi:hypothetical protein
MGKILARGHSRVPVYDGNPRNIIGLLLVSLPSAEFSDRNKREVSLLMDHFLQCFKVEEWGLLLLRWTMHGNFICRKLTTAIIGKLNRSRAS